MFDECHPDTVFECNANTFSITEAERNTGGLTQSIYHAKNIASSGANNGDSAVYAVDSSVLGL
jgi:hypothetical protein